MSVKREGEVMKKPYERFVSLARRLIKGKVLLAVLPTWLNVVASAVPIIKRSTEEAE